jgi:iron complex outermembrane recepter protein
MNTEKKPLIRSVLGMALAVVSVQVVADPADDRSSGTSGNDSGSLLQEIVVTATRREESLEKVPISVAALTQNDLTQGHIESIQSIAQLTPGLQFAATTGAGTPSTNTTISIRGINTDTGAGVVGVYLDDTPIQGRLSPVGNIGNPYPDVFDMNRVEVERGPQGTLFGAGSEAGTVRFITNQPSLTAFTGFAHTELAMTENGHPSYEYGVAAGGPIVEDKLGFRVSVWRREDGGYVNVVSPLTGDLVTPNANKSDKTALKAALAFQATDNIRITPSMFFQDNSADDSGRFYNYFSPHYSQGAFNDAVFYPENVSDRFVLPSVKVEAQLSFADLTSVTSYMDRTEHVIFDLTSLLGAVGSFGPAGYGSPLGPEFPTSPSDAAPLKTQQSVHGVTEEVRLASNQPNALFSWVGGLFYDHRSQRDISIIQSLIAEPTGAPALIQNQLATDEQIAAFFQGDIHFYDKLTATLGMRAARVKSDYLDLTPPTVFEVGVPPVATASLSQTPTTPRIALSYQADSNNLLYVAASKGFRIGGGNAPLPTNCHADVPNDFKSDYIWSYEAGAKNNLFGGRLQIDSSIFHIIWYNIQQEVVLNCGLQYTANTGRAESNGFDLALRSLVTDRLRVDVDVGYVNAFFTQNVFDQAGQPLVFAGDKLGFLPQVNSPWDANSVVNYEIPLSQGNRLQLRGEYQYHSRNPGPFYTQIPTSPNYYPGIVADPPTHLFNARVGFLAGKLDVTCFVENVFNSHPLLGAYQSTPTESLISYSTFRPRTLGISANLDF